MSNTYETFQVRTFGEQMQYMRENPRQYRLPRYEAFVKRGKNGEVFLSGGDHSSAFFGTVELYFNERISLIKSRGGSEDDIRAAIVEFVDCYNDLVAKRQQDDLEYKVFQLENDVCKKTFCLHDTDRLLEEARKLNSQHLVSRIESAINTHKTGVV